jgi:hypothetical protein
MIPNASAVVFRRRAYLAAGPADASLRLCGDWLVWSRICLAGGVAFVAEPLNRFRQHGGTVRASTGGRRELMERLRVIGAIGLEAGATVEALGRAREYQEWLVLRRLSLEWPRPRLPRYARCFAAYARVFGLHGLARFAWLLARHDASVPWKLLAARMGWVDVVC